MTLCTGTSTRYAQPGTAIAVVDLPLATLLASLAPLLLRTICHPSLGFRRSVCRPGYCWSPTCPSLRKSFASPLFPGMQKVRRRCCHLALSVVAVTTPLNIGDDIVRYISLFCRLPSGVFWGLRKSLLSVGTTLPSCCRPCVSFGVSSLLGTPSGTANLSHRLASPLPISM